MNILLNKAHFPVTVLGPGRRIGIWLQGCSIGCAGCISQDTWEADATKAMAALERGDDQRAAKADTNQQ